MTVTKYDPALYTVSQVVYEYVFLFLFRFLYFIMCAVNFGSISFLVLLSCPVRMRGGKAVYHTAFLVLTILARECRCTLWFLAAKC